VKELSLYIGIDFGTFMLFMSKWNERKQKAEPVPNLHPSGYGSNYYIDNVVYYEESGNLIVGRKALNHNQVDPMNGVREVKRHLKDENVASGNSWTKEISNRYCF
jgi:molecular chaperone DnaK (HSP70)